MFTPNLLLLAPLSAVLFGSLGCATPPLPTKDTDSKNLPEPQISSTLASAASPPTRDAYLGAYDPSIEIRWAFERQHQERQISALVSGTKATQEMDISTYWAIAKRVISKGLPRLLREFIALFPVRSDGYSCLGSSATRIRVHPMQNRHDANVATQVVADAVSVIITKVSSDPVLRTRNPRLFRLGQLVVAIAAYLDVLNNEPALTSLLTSEQLEFARTLTGLNLMQSTSSLGVELLRRLSKLDADAVSQPTI